MTSRQTRWYLASRGINRHNDYTWTPAGNYRPPTTARFERLDADCGELLTGTTVNAYLRRGQGGWELAIWQLRNHKWPTDVEDRPITAHVIGIGDPSAAARDELRAAAGVALTAEPPADLIAMSQDARGYTANFQALRTWLTTQPTSNADLTAAAQRFNGHFTPDGKPWELAVPTPHPRDGGDAGNPKGRLPYLAYALTLALILVALVALLGR